MYIAYCMPIHAAPSYTAMYVWPVAMMCAVERRGFMELFT